MKFSRIGGGEIRQRRSLRILAPLIFLGFCGAAALFATDGFAKHEGETVRAAALVLPVGAFCVRIARSRIHLKDGSLVIVNPLFWCEVPYRDVYRAEVSTGGSLVVRTKGRVDEDDDALAVAFAGSLLDQYFKTTERVVKEINKRKKGAPKQSAAIRAKGVTLDVWADFQVMCAFMLLLISLFVSPH